MGIVHKIFKILLILVVFTTSFLPAYNCNYATANVRNNYEWFKVPNQYPYAGQVLYYSTTVMNNGEIMFAGGEHYYTTVPTSPNASIFNPQNYSWRTVANTTDQHYGYQGGLAALPNGNIVKVHGGYTADDGDGYSYSGGSAGYSIYDVETNTWTPHWVGSMYGGLPGVEVLNNGNILKFGGAYYDYGSRKIYVEIIDPRTHTLVNSYMTTEVVGYYSSSTVSKLPDGRIIILTGTEIIIFSADGNSYTFGEPIPEEVREEIRMPYTAQSTLRDGRVLVTAGKQTWFYSSQDDVWERGLDMPVQLLQHTQETLKDGRVVLFCGTLPGLTAAKAVFILSFGHQPEINLITANNRQLSEDSVYNLEGQVRDLDGDELTIRATVGGLEKKIKITNTENWKNFSIPFDMKDIGQGKHTAHIIVDDGNGGKVERTLSLESTVALGNNVYILVDTLITSYPDKKYTDPENDYKYQEQYKFEHDETYYDNANGLYDKHNQWLTLTNTNELPVNRFQKVGKYALDYRARDNPLQSYFGFVSVFDEFMKWSELAINRINFFIHRKPIVDYIVQLTPNGSTRFNVRVKDYSYDLDNISKANRGIKQIQTRYKKADEEYYTYQNIKDYTTDTHAILTANIGDYYDIGVRVRDIDGTGSVGQWADWKDTRIYVNTPPPVGFTVAPKENPRNAVFTITPNAGVGNADYTITKNTNTQNVLTRTNSGAFAYSFSTLDASRDYYTIKQRKTVNGVTAEHIETISVYNRIPILSNFRITNKANTQITLTGTTEETATLTNNKQPRFYWNYADADGDTQKRYQVRIFKNEGLIASSGAVTLAQTNWQTPLLDENVPYKVTFEAYDGYDWSLLHSRYFIIRDNQPPVAAFDIIPNPTDRMTDTDFISKAYDPDGDPLTYYWEYRKYGDTIWSVFPSGERAKANPTMRFLELGEYEIRQTVTDDKGLQDQAIEIAIVNNIAPVALFDIQPVVAYEGDTLVITDQSSDPEGDMIVGHEWEIREPDSTITEWDTENIQIPNSKHGTYNIRKRVMDEYGDWSEWTPWVEKYVNELTVTGYIKHTDRWDENRKQYNRSISGTDFSPRSYDVFFPGEKFLLEANTTVIDPLSSVQCLSVQTSIINHPHNTMLTSINKTAWSGDLWDQQMMYWRNQQVTFLFRANWNNGTIKEDRVTIIIDDDPYWRQRTLK